MNRLELPIEGMTCEHCVRSVSQALSRVPGVKSVHVSLENANAVVESDDGLPARELLAEAVEAAGYRVHDGTTKPVVVSIAPFGAHRVAPRAAETDTTEPRATESSTARLPAAEAILLNVDGMTCASCVARVERALNWVPGVTAARANLATNQAVVEFQPDRAQVPAMLAAVERAGYHASPADSRHGTFDERAEQELRVWRRRLIAAAALVTPILLLHFFPIAGPFSVWVPLACATMLQFYVGWPYYEGAWRRLKHGSANMDTLVAIGTSAAYGSGMYNLLAAASHAGHSGSMDLMDAGLILTFITLGKYLEAGAKGRASAAIRKLLDLAPPVANVLRDGTLAAVSPSQVAEGETIVVRPGEKVPLDAEVLSGQSSLDESWLTGESLPVDKSPGSEILAGTINGQGSLTARVLRPAGRTALQQVVELVRRAQESKTQIQRLADQVVSWFVPIVLVIAAVTLLAWGLAAGNWPIAIACTVSVLVVACPCALGLATPTAILVASGRGAEQGILIKEAHSLELAGRVTTVVLDKTGTVTLGEPRVTRIVPADGVTEAELLATAAGIEQLSQHPLADAIVKEAQARGLSLVPASDLEIVPGRGIRAHSAGGELLVGHEALLDASRIDHAAHERQVGAMDDEGHAPLLVARNGQYLGLIAVADPVAPHSQEAIELLKSLGLKVLLLTGDRRRIADRVAREVGIEEVRAEVLPGQKQEVVAGLRERGEVVAMVGDGVNDAPALAAADLGVAMASGSDIAMESADIVISSSDLRGVPRAVQLARLTLRTIKQNLAWAFLYNIVLIPIAAGVLVPFGGIRLPAIAAAAAMALSSVSVVMNSLLLRARRLDGTHE